MTPECVCMIEIRANGKPVPGPATVQLMLCPLHEAASELYEALEAMLKCADEHGQIGGGGICIESKDAARKALAKARRETV